MLFYCVYKYFLCWELSYDCLLFDPYTNIKIKPNIAPTAKRAIQILAVNMPAIAEQPPASKRTQAMQNSNNGFIEFVFLSYVKKPCRKF